MGERERERERDKEREKELLYDQTNMKQKIKDYFALTDSRREGG